MNTFETWSNESEQDDEDAVWKRSCEIRQLVEGVHPKAVENIKKSQEIRRKSRITLRESKKSGFRWAHKCMSE